jgi:hypothetical protein
MSSGVPTPIRYRGFVTGSSGTGDVEHLEHDVLRFTDGQAAHRITLEIESGEALRRKLAQLRNISALDDAEHRLSGLVAEGHAATLGPAQRHFHGALDLGLAGGQPHAFIQLHLNIGSEQSLDLDRAFRAHLVARAINMRLERDTLLADLAQGRQRHHLEAA